MRAIILVTIVAATVVPAVSQSTQVPTGSGALAVIEGQLITEDEVERAAEAELERLQLRRLQAEASYVRDRHAAIERSLDNIVNDKLLELEASKRGVTVDELYRTEVTDLAAEPSEAEIIDFYEANQQQINLPREQALAQIGPYLQQQRISELHDDFITRLKSEYNVESYLDPLRLEVATENHPSIGPDSAPVTVVEFSDFECPFCRNLYPALKQIERTYPDRVRIVYRQFPLTQIHPRAQKAAEASLCAHEQQRFWDLHDAMFEDQDNLTVEDLKGKAADLNLDTSLFNDCLDSGKYAEAVNDDLIEGSRLGVTGTPAMFINGRFLGGAQPYDEIERIIEEELRLAEGHD